MALASGDCDLEEPVGEVGVAAAVCLGGWRVGIKFVRV